MSHIPKIEFHHIFPDLDHTADVQLHSWGTSLEECFEQCGLAMFGYMTNLDQVSIKTSFKIEVEADDLSGLLFKYLDELLFLFSAEPFLICSKLKITSIVREPDNFRIECICYGEEFDLKKHEQGTEVKAITYGSMQINEKPETNYFDCFVIIDI